MVDIDACMGAVRDVVWVVDDAGAVRYQSPAVERRLGYAAGDFLGDRLLERVHPADRERVDAALLGDEPGAIRFRVRHADGRWVPLRSTAERGTDPETGGRIVAATLVEDIEARARDVERYEVILGSLDDGVYAIDQEGTIVYVNERYAAMKGVERADLLGTPIDEWGSASALERIEATRDRMAAEDRGVGVVEFEFSTVDGGTIPVEMRFASVAGPGEQLERVGVIRDVSERLARERALREKNERLEAFAGIVSHDLRNPLNVAQAQVRRAAATDDTGPLESADAALTRIDRMVDDLLALAREGRSIEEPGPVSLDRVVEQAWGTTETASATLRLDDGTRARILADRDRLQHVFENLFRNAVAHAGPSVTVSVGRTDEGFYVEDDGPGIPAEDRDHVLETGYTTDAEGTGFGLGIVRRIAEAHEWSVAVAESTAGGARFEVTGVSFVDR